MLEQMEVVMPARMTVQESHDIALILQHKVEGFEEVERAFVHGIVPFLLDLSFVNISERV